MDTLSYKTKSLPKEAVEKKWYVVDAEGETLGRLASKVAKIIRGKHKPSFTPHIDCGDNVIVVNAEKVKMTGKKWEQKVYQTYSGYPGGQRETLAKHQVIKHPTSIVEKAVKGMLPKNKLGRAMFKSLYVYKGSEHTHESQQPEKLDLNLIK